jgi:hypothetical protein
MGGTCSWGAHLPACQNPTLSVKHLCQASSVAPPYRACPDANELFLTPSSRTTSNPHEFIVSTPTNFAAAIAGLATSGREDCIYINELEAGLIREQLMPVLRACRSLVRMGGTGLEPVTPSLSISQLSAATSAFAGVLSIPRLPDWRALEIVLGCSCSHPFSTVAWLEIELDLSANRA